MADGMERQALSMVAAQFRSDFRIGLRDLEASVTKRMLIMFVLHFGGTALLLGILYALIRHDA